MFETATTLFSAGGWVMYPLLALSFLTITLSVERSLFWLRTHRAATRHRLRRIADHLSQGDLAAARQVADQDRTLYGRVLAPLLAEALRGSNSSVLDASAQQLAERVRPAAERFSVLLSTIVTAAPMLGILGTVTGIIQSFQLLGSGTRITDPTAVAGGIAEALYTTAFGLVVALVTLFPYVLFRAHATTCFNRIEALAAGAVALAFKPETKTATQPETNA